MQENDTKHIYFLSTYTSLELYKNKILIMK
jgi:hypothetical protein